MKSRHDRSIRTNRNLEGAGGVGERKKPHPPSITTVGKKVKMRETKESPTFEKGYQSLSHGTGPLLMVEIWTACTIQYSQHVYTMSLCLLCSFVFRAFLVSFLSCEESNVSICLSPLLCKYFVFFLL
jgi:hypothetical protein